jgi:NitT/TauT family transport system ATP-binding protein
LEKIAIRGLTKVFPTTYGTVTALSHLDLAVREGEFFVLLGPSGCGKTTLVRIMAGLEQQTSGEITIARTNGTQPPTAMVFQEDSVFPWLTVEANIGYGLRIQGASPGVATRTVRSYLEKVGLTRFARAYPFQLSGGMKKRVSVARAFAADPEVLLMDEPFGELDEQTRVLLQAELIKIWEENRKTVVFITHSIDEAIVLADRILLMTAAPGRVKAIVDVPFPRPRRAYEMRADPEYGRLTGHLWGLLREEVLKAKAEEVGERVATL